MQSVSFGARPNLAMLRPAAPKAKFGCEEAPKFAGHKPAPKFGHEGDGMTHFGRKPKLDIKA